jgi:hypothetical protein
MYDFRGVPIRNSPFRQYTTDLGDNATLNDALRFAKGYVDACCSDLARKIAPEECESIGGWVHVAEITSPGHFRWRIAPKLK